MASKLIRTLKQGDRGPDVLAVKRAMKAAGYKVGIVLTRRFGGALDKQIRRFQKDNDLPIDGVYGQKTHDKLWPYFDDYGKKLLSQAPKTTPEERSFNELIMWCEAVTRADPPYLWGGGHGKKLEDVKVSDGMDCSGSCAKVLYEADLYEGEYAAVSGEFANRYGNPGTGTYYTVYANWEHVFIRFHKGKYWRFDTSPHGDGGRGPELRKLPRRTGSFAARHWPGM